MDNTPRVLAGRYEVGELIGRGGMAEVHIGHDSRLGRTVAIKVLRSDLARDPSFLARFRREAQSAAALNHPAIVAVYDTGEDVHTDSNGASVHVPFIVMEYVEGHTVRDILSDGAAVPIEEAIELTVGVLSALEYSHHAGIVHRDIKPANVMITPTGAVKVMDFGIARAVADSAATMTQTHAVIGTAQYLSPEQARGEQVDARSDLYSTGCLLFELLTGRPPFVGDSPVAVAYQHVGQAPQRPSELASDVPEVLDRITLKALTKDRDARYSTAAEFRSDLEAAARGGNITAPMIGAAAAGAAAGYGATQVLGATPGGTQVMAPQNPGGQWGTTGVQPSAASPPREPEPEEERNRKGLMWTLIAVGALALAAIIAFMLLRPDAQQLVEVPTLPATVSPAEAQERIEDAGFVYVQREDTDSTEPEGTFTRQDPAGGEMAAEGSQVQVWFSTGPDTFAVPDVSGMSIDDARDRLEEEGLVVGEVTERTHATVEKDHVIRTNPQAGQAVQEGGTVDIIISNGQVELPDLTGQSEDAAKDTLRKLGLSWGTHSVETGDAEPGTVVEQSPEPGPVTQGSEVDLGIATEPEPDMVQVPNVVGMDAATAEETLYGSNLNPRPRTESSDEVCPGFVISQDPPAGSEVEVGTDVTYVVSLGPGVNCESTDDGSGGEGGDGTEDGSGDFFGDVG